MWQTSIEDIIGHTPLVKINKLNPNPRVTMLAKLEAQNPGGSIKDRIATTIINRAEKEGKLKPGGTVVEATGAGNTGIGLAIIAAVRGYKSIFVLPDKVSEEKRNLLRAFGAKVVIAPTAVSPDDPRSYYRVADKITKDTPGAFQAGQYTNPANPEAHYATTGPEIWEQTDGKVTHVVIGMGTGGTISGIGKYLKEKNPNVKIIGVDSVGSLYLHYFKTGELTTVFKTYKTEGIGEDFLPQTMDFSIVDDVIQVDDKENFLTARRLAKEEGILVGSSAGAALAAARKVVKRLKSGIVVVVLPDSGRNYLSKFFNDEWMQELGFLDNGEEESVQPLLNKKLHLITVDAKAGIQDAINIMHKYQISQLPVTDDKKIVGSINEAQLVQSLIHPQRIPVNVAEIMDKEVITLPQSSSVHQLAHALAKKELVIIIDKKGKPVDVLTRIDILSYLTK